MKSTIRFSKIFLAIIKVTSITVVLLMVAAIFITIAFENSIKGIAIRELNKQLATEVKVNGDVSFSFLSHFPYASLQFNQVEITESLPEKNNLLSAQKISLLFNVWDLLGSNYKIVKIIMSDGAVNIHVTAQGQTNFDIIKKTASSKPSDFRLNINNAILSNILIDYIDDRSNQRCVLQTHESSLSGDFSSDHFLLDIQSDLLAKQLLINGEDFLPERDIKLSCRIDIDLAKNFYSFKNGTVEIAGNRFAIDGNVLSLVKGNQLDLHISGKELKIEKIASLLPLKLATYCSHFSSRGNLGFDLSIKGNNSADESPLVNCSFVMKDGSITHDNMKATFDHVNLNGVYSNGQSHNRGTSYVELNNLSALFQGNRIEGSAVVRNLENPYFDINLNGNLFLRNLAPMLESDLIKDMDGSVSFSQFYFRGAMNSLVSASNFNNIAAGGSFKLDDVKVATAKAVYTHLNGSFQINNNEISFQQFRFNARESDLQFEGTIKNVIPFLITSLNTSGRNTQKITANVALSSHHLQWEDLVGTSVTTVNDTPGRSNFSIPPVFYFLQGNITGNVEHFNYLKFSGSNLHGNVVLPGEIIFFNDVGMNTQNGTLLTNGKLDISDKSHNLLDLTAKVNQIDITQLFYEFDNFGQGILTSKNLKGFVTSTIVLHAAWNGKIFDASKLYALADVTIENGELNNFQPMMALASFVKVEELKNIQFSRLQNQVEIKDRTINIPITSIFTNALNLQLSGTHSFENDIDYKVQLNLLKLLTTKFRKSSLTVDDAEQNTQGFLNLYLTMAGKAGNPLIRYDKQKVKEEIAQDLHKEKNNLKDALNNEFNKQADNHNQMKDWKAPSEAQYLQFENDSSDDITSSNTASEKTNTQQKQQKAVSNFKNIFKPKSLPRDNR
ncbi:MAG: hypothetical protein H0W62_04295 [Chitinophagales bacterium]|nr:hypothetical protein [Chitinophagales bacterium]